jgi:IS30 family transposase
MRASTPAVYLYLYGETAKDPAPEEGGKRPSGQISDRVSLNKRQTSKKERPKIVEEKTRTGDGEGDTIESAETNACIATFAGRKTKLLPARLMPDKTAASLNKAVASTFGLVPSSVAAYPDGGQRQGILGAQKPVAGP